MQTSVLQHTTIQLITVQPGCFQHHKLFSLDSHASPNASHLLCKHNKLDQFNLRLGIWWFQAMRALQGWHIFQQQRRKLIMQHVRLWLLQQLVVSMWPY